MQPASAGARYAPQAGRDATLADNPSLCESRNLATMTPKDA